MEEKKKKNLEIISGNGSNLDISPAYDQINVAKPKSSKEKPTNIVIPKPNNSKDKKNKNSK